MIAISLFILIAILIVALVLFLKLSPQFGKPPSKSQKAEYHKTGMYKDGKFRNSTPTVLDVDFLKMIRERFKAIPNHRPDSAIPVQRMNGDGLQSPDADITRLFWFGHSAFLLQIDGKNMLIDPMLGQNPSPLPWLGGKRYSKELPIEIEALPFIDAIILSHDHYDHLDYGSIQKLKGKTGKYFVPLGVGNHLIEWGVDKAQIVELKWWDKVNFEQMELVCTPARHFSGRGLFDRFSTLWCSWVIKGKSKAIFFSGDSGYNTHFKAIGDKYGPFDLALMECGQYNEQWRSIHMFPEETVQATMDVKAKLMMPIHWGAFSLAFHTWTDPIERLIKKGNERDVAITTPKIGQSLILENSDFPREQWWKD